MSLPTDSMKMDVVIACETKNNGEPTYIGDGYIDCAGWNQVTWLLILGAIAAIVNMKIQECDDAVTWVDIAGAALSAIPAATGDNKVYTIEITRGGSTGRKRYQRAVCTVADGAPGAALAILPIRSTYSGQASDVADVDFGQKVEI
jgi:hypothetical protein